MKLIEVFRAANTRLFLLGGVFALCLLYLLGGLVWHQLIQSSKYREAEERQNFRRVLMPGPRGNLFDREGRLLVGNRALFSAVVYLNWLRPEFRREYIRLVRAARESGQPFNRTELNHQARLNVVQGYIDQVNRITGRRIVIGSVEIEKHFSQNLLLPFPLVRDLGGEEYARLVEQIPVTSPLQILTESTRYYPQGSLGAHVLGYVSNSSEVDAEHIPGEELLTFSTEGKVGRTGVEKAFEAHLQGQPGGEIWSVDPGGYQHERVLFRQPVKGKDLMLSLDLDLQRAAEAGLDGKVGAAVCLDIQSGEVLALASAPGYDLNEISPVLTHEVNQRISAREAWLNRAVQGLYPPGSTFKIVTAIAGLEGGEIDARTVVHCPGSYAVGKRVFKCNRHSGHGDENLVGAIRDSCNVLFYHKGIAMGGERIAATARLFGFDQATGIELREETHRMLVPDGAWKKKRFYGEGWFDGDTANMAIGQGYLLNTPMQLACFAASLARGETRTRPTLLRRPGQVAQHGGQAIPLRPEQFQLILEGMRAAGQTGTAKLASSPEIAAAGKTGTAQVRKGGKPTTLAWFIGFAPANRPEIACAILVEGVPELETNYGGGSTAGPIARNIFRTYRAKQLRGQPAPALQP